MDIGRWTRHFFSFFRSDLIFCSDFCGGICDRDGITFSPIYNMFKDMVCFIRFVHSVSHLLTMTELGSDPTVLVLDDSETQRLTGRQMYPSAIVSAIGNDTSKSCTIGPPIWSRGAAIRLIFNLLNLDGGAPWLWTWCWCWFSGWLCCCVHRGPSHLRSISRCSIC